MFRWILLTLFGLLLAFAPSVARSRAEALQFDTTPAASRPSAPPSAPPPSTAPTPQPPAALPLSLPLPPLSSAPSLPLAAAQPGRNAPPGIGWLQSRPMTLFDLGMMELSDAATKATEGLFDVAGAVAEYRANVGKIAVTFYARTAYSEQNCTYVVRKLRDQMFLRRDDPAALQRQLASYFVSYNPENDSPPPSIGEELLDGLSFVVFLPGGACELPVMSERIVFLADPNYKPAASPPSSSNQKEPGVPDVTKLLGSLLGGGGGTGVGTTEGKVPPTPPTSAGPRAPTAPKVPQPPQPKQPAPPAP